MEGLAEEVTFELSLEQGGEGVVDLIWKGSAGSQDRLNREGDA